MIRSSSIFAAVAFVTATPALADQRGNGGDVVVCVDAQGTTTSVELLDFYEGRSRLGFQLDLADGVIWQEKLEGALARLGAVDPDRAAAYRLWAGTFESDTHFWPDVVLPDVPDSGHIAVPRGCTVEQIAIQREPTFPEEKYYTINFDLWEHLDEAGKAGLVLHELVFREALRVGHVNSIQTRYFNALITSRSFVPENVERFLTVTKSMMFGVERVGYRGLVFVNNEWLRRHPSGTIASGQLKQDGRWRLPNGMEIGLLAPYSGWVGGPTFHPNGHLASGNLAEDTEFRLEEGSSVTARARYDVAFDAAGRLVDAHIGLAPTTFAVGPHTIVVTHDVIVHAGRYVVGGYLHEQIDVEMCGRVVTIDPPAMIVFDETRIYLKELGHLVQPNRLCFRNPASGGFDAVEMRSASRLVFDAEGAVARLHLSSPGLMRMVQGLQVSFSGAVSFHPNGGVAHGLLDQARVQLRTTAGELVTREQGAVLAFDEDGILIAE